MKNGQTAKIALGGIMAAVAMVIMILGGLIPVATFICPTLCILICETIRRLCGNRIAWAWYGTVSCLSLLFAPDKEAAAVFLILGYYPIVKPWFERCRIAKIFKFFYFNVVIYALYLILIYILGMDQIVKDYTDLGAVGLVVLLLLGNIVFYMLDRILGLYSKRK